MENLTKLVQQKRVHAAQAAITEYNKWAAYPCGYAPPGTYTYTPGTNCGVPGGLGGLFTTTPPPSFNSFQAYGAYLAYQSIVDDPSFQSAQWGTAQAILLGATVPAAIGAGAAATAFTTALYAGGVSVSPILTAATTATDVAIGAEVGAFTVGAALAVVLIAIVIGVFHVYDTVTDADIPTYLNNALNVASSTPVDLPTVITTDAGMQEVFTVFLGTTLPDYPALQPVPAPQSSDRKFFLQADGAASATSSPTLAYKAWDGSTHKARLNGGWFVDTDAAGKSKVALEIGYVQSDGTHWTAWRVGDRFLHTAVTNPLDTPVLDDQVHLLNPAGMAYHVSLSLQPGVWSLGTGGSSGDGSVSTYNSTTTGWTGVDGLAKRVAVGGDGQPWAINSKGDVFRRNGFVCVNGGPQATHAGYVDGEWQLRLGANASAIGVGADGSVWIIDTTPGPKGKGNGVERRMYQATDQMDILGTWNRDVWKKMVGPEGVAIAVGPDGQPWVVNSEGVVWSGVKGGATNSYIDGSFQAVPNGRARDIAVGGDGSVWVIGTDRVDGGSSIWKYGGNGTWQHVSGAGSRIAVDGLGNPWVVNDLGVLWRYDIASSQWHVMSAPGSITAIAVGGLSAGPASPSVPGMTPLPCAPDLLGPGF